jgi:hypothetical protein
MAYRVGIMGPPNTGKSYSRRFIKKGQNTFILQPSMKASHLLEDGLKPIGAFDISGEKFKNLKEAKELLNTPSTNAVIDYFNRKIAPGKFKRENVKGNVQLVKDLNMLPVWMKFIDIHMPWIDTIILADFTHYLSEVISDQNFIERKAGGEAYQRFWELAGVALRNFITGVDGYRNDLVVVTEFHADFDEKLNSFQLYTPAGKMITEKFKPETYYDVLLCTEAEVVENDSPEPTRNYYFITEKTAKYPLARAMNMFDTTRIPNNLQMVLDKVRESMAIPSPEQ